LGTNVDVDRALALDRDSLKLLGIKLNILTFADLIALDDICRIHFVGRFGIDLAVLDTMASLLVELMEPDLLALRSGRKESNWT
jgi:hypothetical protein